MSCAHSIDRRARAQRNSAHALTELGVRVVKRVADLTVTLVNDYLEERLAELNRQHLSDQRPGCSFNPPAFFPWWVRCSARARAPAGPVLPTG